MNKANFTNFEGRGFITINWQYPSSTYTSLDASSGVTHAVVLKLIEGLEQRGHHVYMDNHYSSPTLFSSLRQLGFGACGTVHSNRKGMPKIVTASKLKKD